MVTIPKVCAILAFRTRSSERWRSGIVLGSTSAVREDSMPFEFSGSLRDSRNGMRVLQRRKGLLSEAVVGGETRGLLASAGAV
jgi:hypothetical protein